MMKKIVCLLLIILFLFGSLSACGCEVFAINDYFENERLPEEKTVKDVLLERADTTIDPVVYNRELYHETLQGYELTNKPIVRRCHSVYWEFFAEQDKTIDSTLAYANTHPICDYIVFDEQIFMIYTDKRQEDVVIGLYKGMFDENAYGLPLKKGEYPQYLLDLNTASTTHEVNGVTHTITNVYCLDGTAMNDGIAVYYVTDKGDFVTWYADNYSQGVDFSAPEFREYAELYYAEMVKNSVNENGEPVSGELPSFLEVVNASKEQMDNNAENVRNMWHEYIWVLPCVLIIIGAGCLIAWKIKRKA